MSLRERLAKSQGAEFTDRLFKRLGILQNPFPAANQTSGHPHWPMPQDGEAEDRIVTFLGDGKSQVVVVEGTQGVGKTNFLNHFEMEIRSVLNEGSVFSEDRYYMVRYLADPEPSFDGMTRRLFEELGVDHLKKLSKELARKQAPINEARSRDMQKALRRLAENSSQENLSAMMEWLLGLRLLKSHRAAIGVQFRLDTVESKVSALRDLVQVSGSAGILDGIFLLLDELEKQGGVLTPRPLVRYLSAIRSIVDALPNRLFLMIGVTPDALRRYQEMLPALRGRLQNQITLSPLEGEDDALKLKDFYVDTARKAAQHERSREGGQEEVVDVNKVRKLFAALLEQAGRRGDKGVRQREFLHKLHLLAEDTIRVS